MGQILFAQMQSIRPPEGAILAAYNAAEFGTGSGTSIANPTVNRRSEASPTGARSHERAQRLRKHLLYYAVRNHIIDFLVEEETS